MGHGWRHLGFATHEDEDEHIDGDVDVDVDADVDVDGGDVVNVDVEACAGF